MTIEQSILAQLTLGPATIETLYENLPVMDTGKYAGWRPYRYSLRSRLSRLVKEGRIVRTDRATYALPKKTRRRRTATTEASPWASSSW